MKLRDFLISEKPISTLTIPSLMMKKIDKRKGYVIIKDKSIANELMKLSKDIERKLVISIDKKLADKILKLYPYKTWERFSPTERVILFTIPEWVGKGEQIKMKGTGEIFTHDINHTLTYTPNTDEMELTEKKKSFMSFSDFISEDRPKLIPFRLRKTNYFWTLKNLEDNKIIMLKQFNIKRLREFLKDVNAYDDIKPLSAGFNFDITKKKLISDGEITIHIPANRIEYMKTVYCGNGKSPYNNTKKYNFKDTEYDIDDYEKSYKY